MKKITICAAVVLFCILFLMVSISYQKYVDNRTLLERKVAAAQDLLNETVHTKSFPDTNGYNYRSSIFHDYGREVRREFENFVQKSFQGNREKAIEQVRFILPNSPQKEAEHLDEFVIPTPPLKYWGIPEDTPYIYSLGNVFMDKKIGSAYGINPLTKALSFIVNVSDQDCYAISGKWYGDFDEIFSPSLKPFPEVVHGDELSVIPSNFCFSNQDGKNYYVSRLVYLEKLSVNEFIQREIGDELD